MGQVGQQLPDWWQVVGVEIVGSWTTSHDPNELVSSISGGLRPGGPLP